MMAVPEAAMNKNNSSPPAENNVGPAGQSSIVQPETQSETMKERPNEEFRRGITRLNLPHVPAAMLG